MSCRGPENRPMGRCLLSMLLFFVLPALTLKAGEHESIEKRLLDSLSYLASDRMKGRAVGSPELDEAAEFIRREFTSIGLLTQVYDDGPFQTFNLGGRVQMGSPDENSLVFVAPDGGQLTCELDEDFRPLAIGGSQQVQVPLLFAGYGITAPEYEYDDYQGLDVEGKAVVVLRKEPQQSDRDSVFRGRANSKHAYFRAKIENAAKHGAAAVVLVNDRPEIVKRTTTLRNRWKRKLRQLASEQKRLADLETIDDDNFKQHRQLVARLTRDLTSLDKQMDRIDPILAVDGAGAVAVDGSIPVFFCSRQKVDQVLEQAQQPSLAEIEEQLDELQPIEIPLPEWTIAASARLEPLSGRNVLAILEGQGELADETVIVGAHYDHVGMGGMGSLAPWTRAVHNGADDNASGVVALLEVARQLAARREPLRRRVVFIAFTAEEMGLLGSAHYIREPRFPLSNTIAMLNLDMVGRLNDSPLTIQGRDTAEDFKALLDEVMSQQEMGFKHKRGGNGPSDHAVFFRRGIPVMHFFTGIHRDYHRPSDDVEKVDIVGLRRISSVVADITTRIANAESAPTFLGKKKVRDTDQSKNDRAEQATSEKATSEQATSESAEEVRRADTGPPDAGVNDADGTDTGATEAADKDADESAADKQPQSEPQESPP